MSDDNKPAPKATDESELKREAVNQAIKSLSALSPQEFRKRLEEVQPRNKAIGTNNLGAAGVSDYNKPIGSCVVCGEYVPENDYMHKCKPAPKMQQARPKEEQDRIAEIEASSPFPKTSCLHGEYMFREIEKMDNPAPVKPREWILGTNILGELVALEFPKYLNPALIHVIEKSAYAELQAEVEKERKAKVQVQIWYEQMKITAESLDVQLAATTEREADLIEALNHISDIAGALYYGVSAREALEANKKAKDGK